MRTQQNHHHHHHNHEHQHNQQSTSSWFTRVRLGTTRVDLDVALSRHSENVPLNVDVVPEITMQMKIYPDVQKMRRRTTNEMKIYPDICKTCITTIKLKTTIKMIAKPPFFRNLDEKHHISRWVRNEKLQLTCCHIHSG